jgi:hypothetical protein
MSEMAYKAGANYAAENLREFKKLRADADAWSTGRTSFMLGRIAEGKHPDTDSDFWTGYVERPKPDIWTPPFWETFNFATRAFEFGPVLVLGVAGIWLSVLGIKSIRRRRLLRIG